VEFTHCAGRWRHRELHGQFMNRPDRNLTGSPALNVLSAQFMNCPDRWSVGTRGNNSSFAGPSLTIPGACPGRSRTCLTGWPVSAPQDRDSHPTAPSKVGKLQWFSPHSRQQPNPPATRSAQKAPSGFQIGTQVVCFFSGLELSGPFEPADCIPARKDV